MKEKLVLLVILGILLASGYGLISRFKLPSISLPTISLSDFQSSPAPTLPVLPTTIIPTRIVASPTVKVVASTPRPCYKFTFTKTLCYSESDYDKLVDLSFQLSSAQNFYQFHLDGVVRYQQEYDKTGSSIYLDAKASSQAKADAEKQKIDSATSAMYNLELKGY